MSHGRSTTPVGGVWRRCTTLPPAAAVPPAATAAVPDAAIEASAEVASARLRRRRQRAEVDDQSQRAVSDSFPELPLAAGELTRPDGVVARIANAHAATTGQVAVAWLLQRSPIMLPIPGTLRVAHLEQNVAAAGLSLTPKDVAELDAAA